MHSDLRRVIIVKGKFSLLYIQESSALCSLSSLVPHVTSQAVGGLTDKRDETQTALAENDAVR